MATTSRWRLNAGFLAVGLSACLSSSVLAQPSATSVKSDLGQDQSAPVTIMALGNKLIITSEDRAALTLVSELVRLLTSAPARAGDFEIIRVKHANAVEVSAILDEIFNGPKNQGGGGIGGGMGGGMGRGGGFGGGGIGALLGGGSTREDRIRIVPDPATNALIVSASPLDILTIRSILARQLDAGVTDNDALIRTFVIGPLKAAYAVDVAAVIREVYRESMNNNRRGLGQISEPFAGVTAAPTFNIDANGNSKGVALSLGLDDKTNSLIVACPTPMYKEIKALVERMEAAAATTKQTVKIVRVLGVDPNLIQQALDAIQGRSSAHRNTGAESQGMSRGGNVNPNQGGMFGNNGMGGRFGGNGFGAGGGIMPAGGYNNPTFTPGLGVPGAGAGKGPG